MDGKTQKLTFIDTENVSFGTALRYKFKGLPQRCKKNLFINLAKYLEQHNFLTKKLRLFANKRLETLDEKECLTIQDLQYLDPHDIDFAQAEQQFKTILKSCKRTYTEVYNEIHGDT